MSFINSQIKNFLYSFDLSIIRSNLQVSPKPSFANVRMAKRYIAVSVVEEMFKTACSTKGKRYALFQGEDESKARGETICHLTVIGKPHLQMWVAGGIAKNFKYKRTIDLG